MEHRAREKFSGCVNGWVPTLKLQASLWQNDVKALLLPAGLCKIRLILQGKNSLFYPMIISNGGYQLLVKQVGWRSVHLLPFFFFFKKWSSSQELGSTKRKQVPQRVMSWKYIFVLFPPTILDLKPPNCPPPCTQRFTVRSLPRFLHGTLSR